MSDLSEKGLVAYNKYFKTPPEILFFRDINEYIIIDGRHRVAAGILIGLKTVKIEYGGRSDIEDYLMGISEERPEEILTL